VGSEALTTPVEVLNRAPDGSGAGAFEQLEAEEDADAVRDVAEGNVPFGRYLRGEKRSSGEAAACSGRAARYDRSLKLTILEPRVHRTTVYGL
jgi:hypothetical protein